MAIHGYAGPGSTLLLALAGALGAAALGPWLVNALPFDRGRLLGAMGALAGGLMLGVAYLIMAAEMAAWPALTPVIAVSTIPFMASAHRRIRTLRPLELAARRMALLHGIPEGLALGAALALQVPLGAWLVVTVGLHNAAEGGLFDARARVASSVGVSVLAAMRGAVTDKLPQAAAAAGAFALVSLVPVTQAPVLAVSFTGLVYLVIAELLPEAYERLGRVGVAFTVMAAGGVVALLGAAL